MLKTIIAFCIFAGLEKIGSGYAWPKQPRWVLRGVLWLIAVLGINHLIAMLLFPLLEPFALMNLSFMGLWGVIPSILIMELMIYGYHRALHNVPVLWRIHQWHHSSERIDIWSAYRVHPLELPMYTVIGITTAVVLGATAEAAQLTSLLVLGLQTIQHTNLRTPEWLGYFIVRPENHMLHHARREHHSNYADLPLIDMLFGSFEMQRGTPEEVGFWDGASLELKRYLLCEDIAAEDKEELS